VFEAKELGGFPQQDARPGVVAVVAAVSGCGHGKSVLLSRGWRGRGVFR